MHICTIIQRRQEGGGGGRFNRKRIVATEYLSHFKGTGLPDFFLVYKPFAALQTGFEKIRIRNFVNSETMDFSIVKSKSRLPTIHLSI